MENIPIDMSHGEMSHDFKKGQQMVAEMVDYYHEHDYESDEDCDAYFLRPTNEYNILDKIKEANKELFTNDDDDVLIIDDGSAAANRRVKFALNLEQQEGERELQSSDDDDDGDGDDDADLKQANSAAGGLNDDIQSTEAADDLLLRIMDEQSMPPPSAAEIIADDVESICEDIREWNIEEEEQFHVQAQTQAQAPLPTSYGNGPSMTLHRQITFDIADESVNETMPTDADAYDESDELSILVASYIPDTFEIDEEEQKESFKDKLPTTTLAAGKDAVKQSASNTMAMSTLRRPDTDIRFSYKMCCEYRNRLQSKLPKYTGYLSEYGLTREQLAQRRNRQQRGKQRALEQKLQANDDELRRMQDNERAFIRWLRQKTRFPINKTRNMFDYGGHNSIIKHHHLPRP